MAAAPVSPAACWTPTTFAEISPVPSAACCTLRAISCVAEPCSSTALAIAEAISFISLIVDVIPRIAVTASLDEFWIDGDLRADLFRRLGGLLGEALDLGRHHGKPAARLTGTRGLDRGIEREQVGLAKQCR